MAVKSTRTLTYTLKGYLNLEDPEQMIIIEPSDKEAVIHDFSGILQLFNGKEVSFTLKETSKLESEDVNEDEDGEE